MSAASTDIHGYLQVLHKAILVSPWEGRKWPYWTPCDWSRGKKFSHAAKNRRKKHIWMFGGTRSAVDDCFHSSKSLPKLLQVFLHLDKNTENESCPFFSSLVLKREESNVLWGHPGLGVHYKYTGLIVGAQLQYLVKVYYQCQLNTLTWDNNNEGLWTETEKLKVPSSQKKVKSETSLVTFCILYVLGVSHLFTVSIFPTGNLHQDQRTQFSWLPYKDQTSRQPFHCWWRSSSASKYIQYMYM